MQGEGEPSRTPSDLGLAQSPPPIDSAAIDKVPSSLKLQETKVRTVEIVVGEMSERNEGSDGEREDAWDGDTEKKEIEEGEEGIDSEIEKTENEERVESSDNDSKKIVTEKREEGIDGDDGIIETEKREEGIDGDSENAETEKREEEKDGDSENTIESESSSEKEKIEDKEQMKNADSEKEIGDREQIDCGSEHDKIGENGELRDVGSMNKEVDSDDLSEDKGEENEEDRDSGSEKKEGEILLKERVKIPIPYPQRPFTQDCPSYLKTGFCSFGLVCCFNHPLRKSGKVSSNRDCKDRESDGDQVKKEWVERVKVTCAQPYPQREGKEDCLFYMKTGCCSYGANCCFNHPPRDLYQVTESRKDQNVSDEKNGPREAEGNWVVGPSPSHIRRRPDCVRYVKEGLCDYGAECKFFHHRSTRPYKFNLNPRSDWQENFELETNFLGLPLRPGNDDCPEYMKHGACGLSTGCQYNHPNPGPVIAEQDAHKEFYKGDSLPSLKEHGTQVSSPTSGLPPSIKPMFIPTPKPSLDRIKQMLLPPERPNIGDGNKEPQAQRSFSSSLEGSRDAYRVTTTRSNSSGSGCELLEHPERPGEPLCPAYMKSGGCKLKSECWYGHPRDQHPKDPVKPFVQSDGYNRESSVKDAKKKKVPCASVISEKEFIYPERPGEPECTYYMKHGDCKFGSTCKFHHPNHLHKAPTYSSFSQAFRVMSGNGSEENKYPERPGEPECAYYMMHGDCKFGSNCIFHHPKGRNEKKSSQWGYRKF